MKKFICTTSIQSPTKAFKKACEMSDWQVIIAADISTPIEEYKKLNCIILSYEDQEKINKELSDNIGPRSIQRRNFSFIEAYRRGADIICSWDDDNYMLDNWGKNVIVGQKQAIYTVLCNNEVFEPLRVAGGDYAGLYHRGFPVQLVNSIFDQYEKGTREEVLVDIQADLWLGAPDIDAVMRMLNNNPMCNCVNTHAFPFRSNVMGPFNSQNTFLSRKMFPNYCVFPHIQRRDDIWPSYWVQSMGAKVIYSLPTVYQDRNEQSVYKNLADELVMYEKTLPMIRAIKENPDRIWEFVPQSTKEFFQLYKRSFN